ncbi:hypothetical protein AWB81_01890 [Caballeronia arationis]|uniref:hypothetical protein n=1 Tax=Caballeronia arationis TaxID=1777142 RepID=UPI00074D0B82|nr:hypothetical protein [Caballeronia arationis]SAK59757.1 hypothetical protein AWB81_01890 [Caballeronia arationis]
MNQENKNVLKHIKLHGAEIGHVYNCQYGNPGEHTYEENMPSEVLDIKKDSFGRPVMLVRNLANKRHVGVATLADDGIHGAVYCTRSRIIGRKIKGVMDIDCLADAKRSLDWNA